MATRDGSRATGSRSSRNAPATTTTAVSYATDARGPVVARRAWRAGEWRAPEKARVGRTGPGDACVNASAARRVTLSVAGTGRLAALPWLAIPRNATQSGSPLLFLRPMPPIPLYSPSRRSRPATPAHTSSSSSSTLHYSRRRRPRPRQWLAAGAAVRALLQLLRPSPSFPAWARVAFRSAQAQPEASQFPSPPALPHQPPATKKQAAHH